MTGQSGAIEDLDPHLAQESGVAHRQRLAQRLRRPAPGRQQTLRRTETPRRLKRVQSPGGGEQHEQRDGQMVGDAPIGDLADREDGDDEEEDLETVHLGVVL